MVVYQMTIWLGDDIDDFVGIFYNTEEEAMDWFGRATRGEAIATPVLDFYDEPAPDRPCKVEKLWIDGAKLVDLMNTLTQCREAMGRAVTRRELIAEGSTPRFTGGEQ